MKKNQYNKEGRPEGYWEYYFTNGQLDYTRNYINGIENGPATGYFFITARLAYKGSLINKKEVGYWEFYDINGNLRSMEYYLVD